MMKNISFNQSYSRLAVATVSGFNLYNLDEIDKVLRASHKGTKSKLEIEQKAKTEPIFMIERHYEETIVAIVPENMRSKLVLWDYGNGQSFPEKDKFNPILAIKFQGRNVILFFEHEILMHSMNNITFADHHKQHNITFNPKAIHAVAHYSDYGFVAVPYKDNDGPVGQVEIFDTVSWRSHGVFTLHSKPIEALAFDRSGTRLVSASKSDKSDEEMATVIRVFSVEMEYVGERIKAVTKELFEFRQKYFINESIQSLSFSHCAQFMVANTNGISAYVYSLNDSKMTKIDVTGSVVIKKLEKDKTFSKDGKVTSKICTITEHNNELRVVIVTSDLCLSEYTIPSSMGDKYTCLGYYDLATDTLDDSPDAEIETTIKAKLLGYTIFEASAMYNPAEYDKKYFENKAKKMSEAETGAVKKAVQFNDDKLECFYSAVEPVVDAEEAVANDAASTSMSVAKDIAAASTSAAAKIDAQGAAAAGGASTSDLSISSAASTSASIDAQGVATADAASTSSAAAAEAAAALAKRAATVAQLREWWKLESLDIG